MLGDHFIVGRPYESRSGGEVFPHLERKLVNTGCGNRIRHGRPPCESLTDYGTKSPNVNTKRRAKINSLHHEIRWLSPIIIRFVIGIQMNSDGQSPWRWADYEELARQSECFETPHWAIEAILKVEPLTKLVIDPCCGDGRMHAAVHRHDDSSSQGHATVSFDLHDWGYDFMAITQDFLTWEPPLEIDIKAATIFMNPPFSLAVEFIEKCRQLGVRKVIAFNRFAWWESDGRREFWDTCPPTRVYICGARASCWRIDIPPEDRRPKTKAHPNGRGSTTPTAHAWFIWDGWPAAGSLPTMHRIYKEASDG